MNLMDQQTARSQPEVGQPNSLRKNSIRIIQEKKTQTSQCSFLTTFSKSIMKKFKNRKRITKNTMAQIENFTKEKTSLSSPGGKG